jgi:TonB family protein
MDVSTCAKPAYPYSALRAKIGGVTKLRFSIDALGRVNSTIIVKSSGESTDHKLLDQTAAETLSKCMFIPGVDSNGVAFGSSTNVDYVWKLEPQEPIILRSTCENPEYPAESLRADATGTSKIRITVDATGTVLKAGIEVSAGASREHRLLDKTALVALSKCRFIPGIDEQGKPIEGTTLVSYVWKI